VLRYFCANFDGPLESAHQQFRWLIAGALAKIFGFRFYRGKREAIAAPMAIPTAHNRRLAMIRKPGEARAATFSSFEPLRRKSHA
jgi:hypothetical protein